MCARAGLRGSRTARRSLSAVPSALALPHPSLRRAGRPARSLRPLAPRGRSPPFAACVPAGARGEKRGGFGGEDSAPALKRHFGDPRFPLAFLTATWEKITREKAGKRAEELLPPRPFSGTEAPGTEAPLGTYAPSSPHPPAPGSGPPRLEYPSPGPASKWGAGGLWMLLLVFPKVSPRGPTPQPPRPLPSSWGFLAF